MASDYAGQKIQIFTNINDTPRAATSSLAENGSDHTARINQICDYLTADLANLPAYTGTSSVTLDVYASQAFFTSVSELWYQIVYVPFHFPFLSFSGSTLTVENNTFGLDIDIIDQSVTTSGRLLYAFNVKASELTSNQYDVSELFSNTGAGYYIVRPLDKQSGYGASLAYQDDSDNIYLNVVGNGIKRVLLNDRNSVNGVDLGATLYGDVYILRRDTDGDVNATIQISDVDTYNTL